MAVSFVTTADFFENRVASNLGLNIKCEPETTYILCEIATDLRVFSSYLLGKPNQPSNVKLVFVDPASSSPGNKQVPTSSPPPTNALPVIGLTGQSASSITVPLQSSCVTGSSPPMSPDAAPHTLQTWSAAYTKAISQSGTAVSMSRTNLKIPSASATSESKNSSGSSVEDNRPGQNEVVDLSSGHKTPGLTTSKNNDQSEARRQITSDQYQAASLLLNITKEHSFEKRLANTTPPPTLPGNPPAEHTSDPPDQRTNPALTIPDISESEKKIYASARDTSNQTKTPGMRVNSIINKLYGDGGSPFKDGIDLVKKQDKEIKSETSEVLGTVSTDESKQDWIKQRLNKKIKSQDLKVISCDEQLGRKLGSKRYRPYTTLQSKQPKPQDDKYTVNNFAKQIIVIDDDSKPVIMKTEAEYKSKQVPVKSKPVLELGKPDVTLDLTKPYTLSKASSAPGLSFGGSFVQSPVILPSQFQPFALNKAKSDPVVLIKKEIKTEPSPLMCSSITPTSVSTATMGSDLIEQSESLRRQTKHLLNKLLIKEEMEDTIIVSDEDGASAAGKHRPEQVVSIDQAVDGKTRFSLKQLILDRRQAEGKPTINIDSSDKSRKAREERELTEEEMRNLMKRRALNRQVVKKYREKKKHRLTELTKAKSLMKIRQLELKTNVKCLSKKKQVLRGLFKLTMEGKLPDHILVAIKSALTAGDVSADWIIECVRLVVGSQCDEYFKEEPEVTPPTTSTELTSRLLGVMSMPHLPSTTHPNLLRALSESVDSLQSAISAGLKSEDSNTSWMDCDTASTSSYGTPLTSSQETCSSLGDGCMELYTEGDTKDGFPGSKHEEGGEGKSGTESESYSDDSDIEPINFDRPLVIDLS